MTPLPDPPHPHVPPDWCPLPIAGRSTPGGAIGRTLRGSGILHRIGGRGDARDNGQAECFISALKTELIDRSF